jgi:uncharacterized protein YmfQ (DUF2313 family)
MSGAIIMIVVLIGHSLIIDLGIKQIYDLKKIHIYSDKIIRCMFEEHKKADAHVAF